MMSSNQNVLKSGKFAEALHKSQKQTYSVIALNRDRSLSV
jgi:hypothetical protein